MAWAAYVPQRGLLAIPSYGAPLGMRGITRVNQPRGMR